MWIVSNMDRCYCSKDMKIDGTGKNIQSTHCMYYICIIPEELHPTTEGGG